MELAVCPLRQDTAPSRFPLPATTPATTASHMHCSSNMAIRSTWPPRRRPGIAFHWRIQPVIIVAPDGRSARLRTYLFHPNTSKTGSSTLFGAMYPDDHLILEDGIWRLWNLSLDEPYFEMPDWKGGWSAAKDKAGGAKPPASDTAYTGQSPMHRRDPSAISAPPWLRSTGRMCRLPNSESAGTFSRWHRRTVGMAQNSADVVGLQKSRQRPHAGTVSAGLRPLRLRTRHEHDEARLSVAIDRSGEERGLM